MDDKFIFNSGTRWRSNWDGQRLVWIIAPVEALYRTNVLKIFV